jgi:hypothetical protein
MFLGNVFQILSARGLIARNDEEKNMGKMREIVCISPD